MSSQLAVVDNHTPAIIDDFDDKRIKLIRETFANDAPELEFQLFIAICQRTGLSPEARQIYFIGRYDKQLGKKRWVTQTSIDGYRLIADRSRAYAGSDDALYQESGLKTFQGEGGKSRPDKATVTVWKIVQGVRCPFTASARWDEYNAGVNLWKSMPYTMLAKCSEALALRKAFPAELSGLYTQEEMEQAGPVIEATGTMRPATPAPMRRVPGGHVNDETGEFRRVDDAAESPTTNNDAATKGKAEHNAASRPSPAGAATAPANPPTPMQRLHGHAHGRKLLPDDVHALAFFWHGKTSRNDLLPAEINGMIAAFNLQGDQALDDETLATEVVKAYEAVDELKASAPAPGSPEDIATINAIVGTPSTESDPGSDLDWTENQRRWKKAIDEAFSERQFVAIEASIPQDKHGNPDRMLQDYLAVKREQFATAQ